MKILSFAKMFSWALIETLLRKGEEEKKLHLRIFSNCHHIISFSLFHISSLHKEFLIMTSWYFLGTFAISIPFSFYSFVKDD